MFDFLLKKAATEQTYSEQVGPDGNIQMVPDPMVKVGMGGPEFNAKSQKALKAFDQWVAESKAAGKMIQIDDSGASYSLDSPQGKAELIKAELQIKHGLSEQAAAKAVKSIPELNPDSATKAKAPFWQYKGGTGKESAANGNGEAKAAKASDMSKNSGAKGATKAQPAKA